MVSELERGGGRSEARFLTHTYIARLLNIKYIIQIILKVVRFFV